MPKTSTSFRPGVSGNAGGRPRAALDVQALAREHTAAAIQTLVECLRDPRLRVQAATALLDRAWGKPIQPVSGGDGNSPAVQHLIAAQIISGELIRELASQPAPSTAQPSQVVDFAL